MMRLPEQEMMNNMKYMDGLRRQKSAEFLIWREKYYKINL